RQQDAKSQMEQRLPLPALYSYAIALPSSGEIGSFADGAFLLTVEIGESVREVQSPHLRGRWPAGQRGALSRDLAATCAAAMPARNFIPHLAG
ncbi:hypothetical protein NKJ90_32790, partial [Mesorhizobium sp. M0051]